MDEHLGNLTGVMFSAFAGVVLFKTKHNFFCALTEVGYDSQVIIEVLQNACVFLTSA